MCCFGAFQIGARFLWLKWLSWKASVCCCGDLSYGQIREKCIKPQDTVFAKKQTNRKTHCNFKRVMFLLTFHKERIFSLKKISLSFSLLQLGAEIVAPCIMQRKLFLKKSISETTRIRLQFVQMLYKEAECEKLQFVRPHILQFIKKIVKSGFITSRLEPMISKGVTILSDRWFYSFIKSAEWYMAPSNIFMGKGRASTIIQFH